MKIMVCHSSVTLLGVGVCQISRKKHYEGVWSNVTSVTRGCGWGSNFQEKSVT